MAHCRNLVAFLLIGATTALGQAVREKVTAPLPQIKQNGAVKQMYVDGKPFIMLAGELHNSSASSMQYLKPILDKLAKMNLNTVIGTVSWELMEPEEGKFDFTLVDEQIQEARKRNMRLVLIWFATWKNGNSSYTPLWVKTDPKRFPMMQMKPRPPERESEFNKFLLSAFGPIVRQSLSPFGEASKTSDAMAYRALMRHIKEIDPQHTVIMMQVENELGLLGDSRDRSALAEATWIKPVPADLLNYLVNNKATLLPEMQEVWGRGGYKTSGTWAEVFGTDEWAEEVFMAWHCGRYVQSVIAAGKAELNIPMYVNAWLGPQPGEVLPGDWPSGGPVARVMDIWRAAAPSVDFIAPDIYVDDFKGTCALYVRSGNPLFFPEAKDSVGNLVWAIGKYAAMGVSPFGIEDLAVDGQVAQAYGMLPEMLPQLAEWQATGKVAGVLLLDGEESETVSIGGYKITIKRPPAGRRGGQAPAPAQAVPAPQLLPGGVSFETRVMAADTRPFALVINTAPDEFLFFGSNLIPGFASDSAPPSRVFVGSKDEGRFEKGKWIAGRRLNGDEFLSGLPSDSIGFLKVKLYTLD
jgi:hypothetical protein